LDGGTGDGRHALIVVRGPHYREDIAACGPISVSTARADRSWTAAQIALLEVGYTRT